MRQVISTSRPGVTLIEVLVAIFITGVGLLALLTLFPLGAMEMAQAVKDDRTGHIKENAAATAESMQARLDLWVRDAMQGRTTPNGQPTAALPYPANPLVSRQTSTLPGYPVLVDPVGWSTFNGNANWQLWVGGQPGTIPRRTLRGRYTTVAGNVVMINGFPATDVRRIREFFTFMDDMSFAKGNPGLQPPVDREPLYSVAYTTRLPRANTTNVVELDVVVFRGRQIRLGGGGTPRGERYFPASFGPAANQLSITWPAGTPVPEVKPGQWIMDATLGTRPRGYWYRVVNASVVGSNSMELEIQGAFKGFSGVTTGTVLVMDDVIEVFERGTN